MRKVKGPTPIPAYDRVIRKCIVSSTKSWGGTPCLEWTGGKSGWGHGLIRVGSRYEGNSRKDGTHRVAYEHHYGTVPDGLYVCHHCDNPVCCNHQHLFAGTAKENAEDRHRKGRDGNHKGESNGRCRLTEGDVACIRKAIGLGFPREAIAQVYGVCKATINHIAAGRTWGHIA